MDKNKNYYKDTFHHLYNRGANKADIFFERNNYFYFLKKMKIYREKYNIEILSYVLMPNHFHLFVRQNSNQYTISNFISSLLNSYVKSINKKFEKSGTLFQGKTKCKQITDENYFKWVIKYILTNPVKARLVKNITDWEFSNAKDLFGLRKGTLTNVEEITSYFQSKENMIEFLTDEGINTNYEF